MRLSLANEVVMSNVIKLLSNKDKQSLKRVSKAVKHAVLSTSNPTKLVLNSEFEWDGEHKQKAGYYNDSPMGIETPPSADPQRVLFLAELLYDLPKVSESITTFLMRKCDYYYALDKRELSTLMRLPFFNQLEKLQITIKQPSATDLFSRISMPKLEALLITRGNDDDHQFSEYYDSRLMPTSGPTDLLGLAQADMPCLNKLRLSQFRFKDLDQDAYKNLAKATWPLKSLELSDVGAFEGMLDDLSSASWGSTLEVFTLVMEYDEEGIHREELGELNFPALKDYKVFHRQEQRRLGFQILERAMKAS